jgi:hypothetical protein
MANYPNMTNSPASLLKLRMSMVAGLCWLAGASSALAAQSPEEKTMILNEEYAPVILEVMAKSDVSSFDAFKAMVKASKIRMNGPVLEYRTIYGDQLTFDTNAREVPTINGHSVNYAPEKVFESTFLNADWNSGIVTITKGNRKKVLNFESGNSAQGKWQR